jgi:hypothetical protein
LLTQTTADSKHGRNSDGDTNVEFVIGDVGAIGRVGVAVGVIIVRVIPARIVRVIPARIVRVIPTRIVRIVPTRIVRIACTRRRRRRFRGWYRAGSEVATAWARGGYNRPANRNTDIGNRNIDARYCRDAGDGTSCGGSLRTGPSIASVTPATGGYDTRVYLCLNADDTWSGAVRITDLLTYKDVTRWYALTDELCFKFSSRCCCPVPGELDAGSTSDAAILVVDVSVQHHGTRPAVQGCCCCIVGEGVKGTLGWPD